MIYLLCKIRDPWTVLVRPLNVHLSQGMYGSLYPSVHESMIYMVFKQNKTVYFLSIGFCINSDDCIEHEIVQIHFRRA